MTLPEWIAYYNQKNPQDPFVRNEMFDLFFRADQGFCEVLFLAHMVIFGQTAGNARFFRDCVEEIARALHVKEGGAICIRREIRAYIRLFGYRVLRMEELSDGLKRYHCIHKERGTWALLSPAFTYDTTGETAYFVTWEI